MKRVLGTHFWRRDPLCARRRNKGYLLNSICCTLRLLPNLQIKAMVWCLWCEYMSGVCVTGRCVWNIALKTCIQYSVYLTSPKLPPLSYLIDAFSPASLTYADPSQVYASFILLVTPSILTILIKSNCPVSNPFTAGFILNLQSVGFFITTSPGVRLSATQKHRCHHRPTFAELLL